MNSQAHNTGSGNDVPFIHPDTIQFREYKLLLRSSHFVKGSHFHKFWKITRHAANGLGVPLRKRGKEMETHLREVLFFDTPLHFRLYNSNFILRRRTFYKHGKPQPNHELTLKFRHPDREVAEAVDVRPLLPCENTVKFKEEVLLPRDKIGGMRFIYSHGCELDTPNTILSQSFESILQVFPALQRTGTKRETALTVVNNIMIEEVLVNMGELDFGGRMLAKATLAIWRNRVTQEHLLGEYSYQIKFPALETLRDKPRELSEAFFLKLQESAAEWIEIGTTKTALVYSLGRTAIRNHE